MAPGCRRRAPRRRAHWAGRRCFADAVAVVEDDDGRARINEDLDERRAVLHRVLDGLAEKGGGVHAGVDRVRHEAHVRRRHDAAPLEDAVRVDAAALDHRAPVGPALLVGADPRERRLRAEPAAVLVLEREVGVARPLLRELLDVGPRRLRVDAEAPAWTAVGAGVVGRSIWYSLSMSSSESRPSGRATWLLSFFECFLAARLRPPASFSGVLAARVQRGTESTRKRCVSRRGRAWSRPRPRCYRAS